MADYAIHDTTLIGTSNIIRKKEGSSALIDPADYPKRINLMGMLEEKTIVSSPIADFSDGADAVPLKSWEVTLPASLSGYSEVNVAQTGRNLLNYADVTNSYHVTSLTDNGDGSFTVVASGLGAYIDHIISVKAGQAYSIKCKSATNDEGNASQIGVVNVYDGSDDTATLLLNGASISTRKGFTPTGNYILVRNKVTGGSGAGTGTIVEPQLEVGSTSTTYEPYQTPTTHTASLGRTIYGGEVDVVNGTGTDATLRYELDENDSWSAYSGASHSFWHNVATGEDRPIKQTEASESICNYATYSSASPASAPDFSFLIQGGQRIVVTADSSIDTVDKFKTWLSSHNLVFICPASTPTDFTFSPITPTPETVLGTNNFWADEGDSEVTYRSSGTITPIVPTLISKTITANGTYSAEDDDADGYDEVTVNVPSGTPFKYEDVGSSGTPYVFIAMEEGDYLCVLYCSYDGTRTFSTTGTLIFEEDINVAGDSRGIKVALCHLLPNQRISYQATAVNLYNSRLQAIIRLDDYISVSQMVDSYAINDGDTSGYTPSYSGNVLSVAVCGGNNTEHFYDKTIPSASAIENSVYGGLNSVLHIGYGACPNYNMYGYYGNGVCIGLFQ